MRNERLIDHIDGIAPPLTLDDVRRRLPRDAAVVVDRGFDADVPVTFEPKAAQPERPVVRVFAVAASVAVAVLFGVFVIFNLVSDDRSVSTADGGIDANFGADFDDGYPDFEEYEEAALAYIDCLESAGVEHIVEIEADTSLYLVDTVEESEDLVATCYASFRNEDVAYQDWLAERSRDLGVDETTARLRGCLDVHGIEWNGDMHDGQLGGLLVDHNIDRFTCLPFPSASVDPASPDQSQVSASAEILRSVRLNDDDSLLIISAIEVLVADCMTDHGFPYVPEPPRLEELLPSSQRSEIETTIPTIFQESTGQHSYRASELFDEAIAFRTDPPNPTSSENSLYVASLAEADQALYSGALNGTPGNDGCVAAAEQGLLGGAIDFSEFLASKADRGLIRSRLTEIVLFGEAIMPLLEEWDTCMSQAGFPDLFAPNAVVLDLLERYAENFVEAATYETSVATADHECRSLLEFDARAEVGIETEAKVLLDAQQAAIARIALIDETVLNEASNVLASSDPSR